MVIEIETDITQLFVGTRLPAGSTCTRCDHRFKENDHCVVYAARPEDAPTYTLRALYCPECAPDTIPNPTLGSTEYLLTSRLACTETTNPRQQYLTLLTATVHTASPLTDGTSQEVHTVSPEDGPAQTRSSSVQVRADLNTKSER